MLEEVDSTSPICKSLCTLTDCVFTLKLTGKCIIWKQSCTLNNINLSNLALKFPEPLKVSAFVLTMFCVFDCMPTGFSQSIAEHHSAGKLSFTICPSEEADGGHEWRNYPERYQPIQRHTVVTTAGAHFALIFFCVLFNAALIGQ